MPEFTVRLAERPTDVLFFLAGLEDAALADVERKAVREDEPPAPDRAPTKAQQWETDGGAS